MMRSEVREKNAKPIAVFGSVNWDIFAYVDVLPKPGQTIAAQYYSEGLGGKGANQAVAASRLSQCEVKFYAATGDDHYGQSIHEALSALQLNTEHLIRVKGVPSGLALIQVDQSGQNTISIVHGANYSWNETLDFSPHFKTCSVAVFQLETPPEVTANAMRAAREAGTIVILDPAPVPEEPLDTLIKLADVVTPNETEAELITGIAPKDAKSAWDVAARLMAMGARSAVVKMGEKGVALCTSAGEKDFIPSERVRAIDTVGAGDIFNGALAVGLQENMEISEAVKFASRAAALSVTRKGAAISAPSRDELNDFVAS